MLEIKEEEVIITADCTIMYVTGSVPEESEPRPKCLNGITVRHTLYGKHWRQQTEREKVLPR